MPSMRVTPDHYLRSQKDWSVQEVLIEIAKQNLIFLQKIKLFVFLKEAY
jgi:hypothetical protein